MASSSMLTSLLQSLPSARFSFRVNSGIGAYNPLLGLLETKLANQLELLKLQDIDQDSYLSATWLTKAMSAVLSTNSTMKTFLPDLQHTLSESANFPKWLDECLDDNIRLLDACLIMQESLSCIIDHHSYVKSVLALMPSDKPASKATLWRAVSQCGKLTQKRNIQVSSKRSKLETCGSVLRRMGEKLYSLDDSYKGNGWGVMYVAHMIAIFVCGVLMTALSVGPRRTSMTTISISTQSNWSIALSGLQQRIKEQVERKRMRTQRMPYLEELENVDSSLNTLENLIKHAIQLNQFPISSETEELLKESIGESTRFCNELGDGLAHLEQDIYDVYQVLISCRMMLLDIYPKTCTIPRM